MIFKENALFYRGFYTLFDFLRKLVNNGKNVDSANLRMVFSISLVFCLVAIGVCVFWCADSVIVTLGGIENEKSNILISINSVHSYVDRFFRILR